MSSPCVKGSLTPTTVSSSTNNNHINKAKTHITHREAELIWLEQQCN